jgi:hypothetical protein
MPTTRPTDWSVRKTARGFAADEVISALQKEIRRGNAENAVLLAHEMIATSKDLEEFLWARLMVISVEDIGLGEPGAPALVNALFQMRSHLFGRAHVPGRSASSGTVDGAGTTAAPHASSAHDQELLAVHAIRYLCACRKDRSSDEMALWVRMAAERGEAVPLIPDYALDKHTSAGKKMGRGLRHFMEEGAKVSPEEPDRDRTYRERIMALLDEGDQPATEKR